MNDSKAAAAAAVASAATQDMRAWRQGGAAPDNASTITAHLCRVSSSALLAASLPLLTWAVDNDCEEEGEEPLFVVGGGGGGAFFLFVGE